MGSFPNGDLFQLGYPFVHLSHSHLTAHRQMDVRPNSVNEIAATSANGAAVAAPMTRTSLAELLHDARSSLTGKERKLHERDTEIVGLLERQRRMQEELSNVRQTSSTAFDQMRGLERELFETKKQLAVAETARSAERAELNDRLRTLQLELSDVRNQQVQRSAEREANMCARNVQLDEMRKQLQRQDEELKRGRMRSERSSKNERDHTMQTVTVSVGYRWQDCIKILIRFRSRI